MRTGAHLLSLLFLSACGASEAIIVDVSDTGTPADAGAASPAPSPLPDAGTLPAEDAGQVAPPELPVCLSDPLIALPSGGVGFATWLVGGSPCARVSGLPDTGDLLDDELYDSDRDGYLELTRAIPAGAYGIDLLPEDCRTHQAGEARPYTERTVERVRGGDRDVFRCWAIPRINCVDHGGNIYDCWVERINWFCGLEIAVAADGAVTGGGGTSAGRIPLACR